MSSIDAIVSSDSKYRKYTQSIEKALSYFEAINEWADLISFVSKVHKVSPFWNDDDE